MPHTDFAAPSGFERHPILAAPLGRDGPGRPGAGGAERSAPAPSADRPAEANHLLRLLAAASSDEYDALRRVMRPVASEREDVIFEPGARIPDVYFPQSSVCSIVKVMNDGRRVEVGTTGFEGMVGLPVFIGAESTPFQCFVQIPGLGSRIEADAFRRASARGSVLHDIMLPYAQYLFDQAAHSVACNRLHSIDLRCARWLLMTHDRVGEAERFPLTQEFLALMLGVRRASVSVAAEALHKAGPIRYRRGSIMVDRPGLDAAGCECYHTDRADDHRLLG